MAQKNNNENVKMKFLGFDFECSNPSTRTVIIVALLLIFFVVLVVCLPKLAIGGVIRKGLLRIKRLSG